jgi:endoribonuclease Dicer
VRDELRFLNASEDPIPGDAFLKYLSSVYVFVTNPALHEGALHVVRQQIISNKSLHQNAIRVGLPSFIQSKPFTIKLWQPPNFSLGSSLGTTQSPIEGADDDNSADDYDAVKTPGHTASEKAAAPSQPDSSKAVGPTAPSQDAGSESPLAEGSKSKKRSKKKRQQDEQNYQWFGDKVSVLHISWTYIHSNTGCG